MQRYRNRGGTSGVRFFEPGAESIKLWWSEPEAYTYTYDAVGEAHVEAMKRMARQGSGLNTYINQHPEIKRGFVREEAEESARLKF